MTAPVVLIAEPDTSQRQIIDLLLTAGGFDLTFVTDGHEALTFLRDRTPDLVIVAVDLPDVDGLELCRKVRAVRRLARAAVILLAADAAGAAAIQDSARAAGATLVLAAPLGDKNLSERAHALIRQGVPSSAAARSAGAGLPAAAVLAPVSAGQPPDAVTELAQLRQVIAGLTQENALLKRQLAATGRATSGGGELVADLRGRLAEASALLAEYQRRYPELKAGQSGRRPRGLFRRRR
jgi:CheY-like chemotaxis protein